MRRALALAALAIAAFVAAPPARAEKLTIALSVPDVRINSNFTGTTLTIFGVIARDAATVSRPGGYEVAVVLRGPPETVVARRKERVVVIWANGASETIEGAPSFYAVSTSRPLATLAPSSVLTRLGVGFAYLPLAAEGAELGTPQSSDFRDAFIRLQQKAGLYSEQIGGVSFIGDMVFRSTLRIPANVPVGDYTATVYLFAGDGLLASSNETLQVSKIGFEQLMYTVAHTQAPAYGLACVALALFTGWLAGVVFRRD